MKNQKIRNLAPSQIDAMRRILSENPEIGSAIPNAGGTVWFDGCGCLFRTKDDNFVSADIQLKSAAGSTELVMICYSEDLSFSQRVHLTDIVGDHRFNYLGEEFSVLVGPY
jgi:hypothetical protein